MSCFVLIFSSDPFKEPRRVLNFGKYRGKTLKDAIEDERIHGKSGYFEWCLANVKGFKEECNDEEYSFALSDIHVPKCIFSNDEPQGYGWLAAEDCDLLCM